MEDQIFMIEDEISDNSPPGYYVKEPYDYQRQIDKLEGQDQALQLQIHELSNQDSTLQQQIDQLYGNGDHYADRFQELQQRNDSQEEEIDRLRRQNDSLQDQISTIRKETHLELAKLSSHIKICLQNASGMSATTEPRRQNLGVGMGDGSDGSSPRSALETSPAASEHNSSFGPVSPVEYVTLQRKGLPSAREIHGILHAEGMRIKCLVAAFGDRVDKTNTQAFIRNVKAVSSFESVIHKQRGWLRPLAFMSGDEIHGRSSTCAALSVQVQRCVHRKDYKGPCRTRQEPTKTASRIVDGAMIQVHRPASAVGVPVVAPKPADRDIFATFTTATLRPPTDYEFSRSHTLDAVADRRSREMRAQAQRRRHILGLLLPPL